MSVSSYPGRPVPPPAYRWHTCPRPDIDELPVLARRELHSSARDMTEEITVLDRFGKMRCYRRYVINNTELWSTWRQSALDLDQLRESEAAATRNRRDAARRRKGKK